MYNIMSYRHHRKKRENTIEENNPFFASNDDDMTDVIKDPIIIDKVRKIS